MRTSRQNTRLADASMQLLRSRTSLTDSEPLTSEDQKSYSCIKSLLPSGQILPTLRVDPPSIDDAPSPRLSIQCSRAKRDVYTLNVILTLVNDSILPNAHTAALRPRVECLVGDMWYTLIPWLECLLGNQNKRPLDAIQDIIRSHLIPYLFCHKPALRVLLLETPQLYCILFDTWLHFDTYSSSAAPLPDRRAAFGQVLRTIYLHALRTDGDIEDRQVVASHADPLALDCLLSTVQYRPRRLYRHAVRQASLFAHPDALETLQMDLKLIWELAYTLIPIPNHAHDVVRAVVDILRKLVTLDTRESAAAAADGCYLLATMWRPAPSHKRNRRTMTWALRAGALPLMRKLFSQAPDSKIAGALEDIALHAIYVDVLRALVVGAESNNSPGPLVLGFADEATERCINARLGLLASFGRRVCSAQIPSRTLRSGAAPAIPPYTAPKSAREVIGVIIGGVARGRRICSLIGVVAHPHPPEPPCAVSSRDAQFLILCARAYVKDHAQDILEDIRRETSADVQSTPAFDVVIAFETPSPNHHVRLMDPIGAYVVPAVHVVAAVRTAPNEHMAVEVMEAPLSALERVAEGLDQDFERYWM